MIKEIGILTQIFLLLLLLSGCGDSNSKKEIVKIVESVSAVPYDLNNPNQSIVLPNELTEISGLTYSKTSNRLLAINDEQGIIYALNTQSGEVTDEIEFGKPDDYEGIASHDGYVYIVESNGNVKVIKEDTKAKIIEFNDRLSRDNDVEGICYDPSTETLLIAAKGDSETEGNVKGVKSIFTMNIENGAVRKQAYIQVNMKESYKSLYTESSHGVVHEITSSSRFRKYGPSGIAIEPQTNLVYLLSSNSKSLAVLDHNGKVISIALLDKKLHAQPEGITFDSNGNLYISNEGKSGSGMIYKYNRK